MEIKKLESITVNERLFIDIINDYAYRNDGKIIALKNIDKFSLINIFSKYSSVDYQTYLSLNCLRVVSEINIPSLRRNIFNNAVSLKKHKFKTIFTFINEESFSYVTCNLNLIDAIITFVNGQYVIEKYK